MRIESYKDLVVWQKAMDLVEEIYLVANSFPKKEIFGLTSQIQRAAVSVPANIAEGSGREHSKELLQFLALARGSLRELETHVLIAVRLGYLDDQKYQRIFFLIEEVGRMLNTLRSTIKTKIQK